MKRGKPVAVWYSSPSVPNLWIFYGQVNTSHIFSLFVCLYLFSYCISVCVCSWAWIRYKWSKKRAVPRFSAASSKFHGKRQTPRRVVEIRVPRNTTGPDYDICKATEALKKASIRRDKNSHKRNVFSCLLQESPAVADKPARRLQKVCTVYVRAVGL